MTDDEKMVDVELAALELAVEAFKRVDAETAKRMLRYLQARFADEAPQGKVST
jgi:hypothetical protein